MICVKFVVIRVELFFLKLCFHWQRVEKCIDTLFSLVMHVVYVRLYTAWVVHILRVNYTGRACCICTTA